MSQCTGNVHWTGCGNASFPWPPKVVPGGTGRAARHRESPGVLQLHFRARKSGTAILCCFPRRSSAKIKTTKQVIMSVLKMRPDAILLKSQRGCVPFAARFTWGRLQVASPSRTGISRKQTRMRLVIIKTTNIMRESCENDCREKMNISIRRDRSAEKTALKSAVN